MSSFFGQMRGSRMEGPMVIRVEHGTCRWTSEDEIKRGKKIRLPDATGCPAWLIDTSYIQVQWQSQSREYAANWHELPTCSLLFHGPSATRVPKKCYTKVTNWRQTWQQTEDKLGKQNDIKHNQTIWRFFVNRSALFKWNISATHGKVVLELFPRWGADGASGGERRVSCKQRRHCFEWVDPSSAWQGKDMKRY